RHVSKVPCWARRTAERTHAREHTAPPRDRAVGRGGRPRAASPWPSPALRRGGVPAPEPRGPVHDPPRGLVLPRSRWWSRDRRHWLHRTWRPELDARRGRILRELDGRYSGSGRLSELGDRQQPDPAPLDP